MNKLTKKNHEDDGTRDMLFVWGLDEGGSDEGGSDEGVEGVGAGQTWRRSPLCELGLLNGGVVGGWIG